MCLRLPRVLLIKLSAKHSIINGTTQDNQNKSHNITLSHGDIHGITSWEFSRCIPFIFIYDDNISNRLHEYSIHVAMGHSLRRCTNNGSSEQSIGSMPLGIRSLIEIESKTGSRSTYYRFCLVVLVLHTD